MTDEVTVISLEAPELKGIETSRAEHIKNTFQPMTEMLQEFEGFFKEVVAQAEVEITEEVMQKAKRLRLDIAQVRIQAGAIKKAEKEEFIRAGKAVDGVYNILKWAVSDKETTLKSIETYFENKEAVRLEAIQKQRVEELSQYIEDAHERDLSGMEDDVWDAYIAAKKRDYEILKAAKKKAEEDRIAKEEEERLEQIKIKEENARLKKEADEKARQDEVNERKRAKEKSEREAKERAATKERQEQEAKAEKIRTETEERRLAKENTERIAREEAETKREKEAEGKLQAAREANEAQHKKDEAAKKKLQDALDIKNAAEEKTRLDAEAVAKEQARLDADKEHNDKMRKKATCAISQRLGMRHSPDMDSLIFALERGEIPHITVEWKAR